MSYSSQFGYTNVTESTHLVTPIVINPLTDYALKVDEPTQVVMENKTTPLNQTEVLSYMCSDVKKVSTVCDIQRPSTVTTGVQYVIKLDAVLKTTSSTDAAFEVDEPVVAYLTIRHQKSGNVSNAMVGDVVERLLGSCRKADGSWRFGELMRSALKPTND